MKQQQLKQSGMPGMRGPTGMTGPQVGEVSYCVPWSGAGAKRQRMDLLHGAKDNGDACGQQTITPKSILTIRLHGK